jgi:hypothetical protein
VAGLLPWLQLLVGVGLVGYAVVLIGKKAVGYLPSRPAVADDVPVDDVRIVSDLATRLRSQGKTDAVKIALQLHAELLKPEATA